MVHNHDHAGVKWGGGARGGRNMLSFAPPLVAPLWVDILVFLTKQWLFCGAESIKKKRQRVISSKGFKGYLC